MLFPGLRDRGSSESDTSAFGPSLFGFYRGNRVEELEDQAPKWAEIAYMMSGHDLLVGRGC